MLRNSIAKKAVVAVTGLLLFGFVIMHMVGNLQVFLGRDPLNRYAEFLHSMPELLWVARITLLVAVVLHVVYTIKVSAENRASRPQRYVMERTTRATRASRSMLLSGLLVLAFIVYHLLHFTVRITDDRFPNYYEDAGGRAITLVHYEPAGVQSMGGRDLRADADREDAGAGDLEAEAAAAVVELPRDAIGAEARRELRHDTYRMVVEGFRVPAVSIAYIVAMVLLGLHLSHGASSMFQTLGLTSPKYRTAMFLVGPVFATIIVIGNVSMPLAILLDHWTGAGFFNV